MTQDDLMQLKEEIEEAKSKIANIEGQKSSSLETLKEEYGYKTIAQAKKALSTLDDEIEKLQDDIEVLLEEIESKTQN